MFYTFENKNKAIESSGCPLVELKYCKLKPNTPIRKIVSLRVIKFNAEDSLYFTVNDMNEFFDDFENIFNNGIFNNRKQGVVDLFGINYYPPQQLNEIIDKIEKQKPVDYEILLKWLKQGVNYNGFYILGV